MCQIPLFQLVFVKELDQNARLLKGGHYCHRISVLDSSWNTVTRFRSPTFWELNRYFSISTKSVSTVERRIKSQLDILQAPAMSYSSRTYWAPNWAEMENSLHKLFLKYRAEGRLIRQSFFRYHATRLFAELFHFSNGWCAGFLKRKEIPFEQSHIR